MYVKMLVNKFMGDSVQTSLNFICKCVFLMQKREFFSVRIVHLQHTLSTKHVVKKWHFSQKERKKVIKQR